MNLTIKPYSQNIFPLSAVLIKGQNLADWVTEIQQLGLSLAEITVYPLPSKVINQVWGCLVVWEGTKKIKELGKNAYYQLAFHRLFIPEYTQLFPKTNQSEMEKLCKKERFFFHPEIDWVLLETPLNWAEMLALPTPKNVSIISPPNSIFIPNKVKSFQVKDISPEEMLKDMEENLFPKTEKLNNEPLSPAEKLKLEMLRQLYQQHKDQLNNNTTTEKRKWFEQVTDWLSGGDKSKVEWSDKMQAEYEELERRANNPIDQLLDMFQRNADEALKYAIPLDLDGTSRGGMFDGMDSGNWGSLFERWGDFSLFGNGGWGSSGGGGGAGAVDADKFAALQRQYMQTAQDLVKKGEFQKAAFIYLKLLKNPYQAAATLVMGKHYAEAATLYLNPLKMKPQAAECFEKANMTNKAIELYKELNEFEKVGDLYMSLQDRENALPYYEKVVNQLIGSQSYVKASLLYREKMYEFDKAQQILLQGWREQKDAFNCLNNYFQCFLDEKELGNEIELRYLQDTNQQNRAIFLKAILHEYEKSATLNDKIKEIAYEIIAAELPSNSLIARELHTLTKADKRINKDILRFKWQSK